MQHLRRAFVIRIGRLPLQERAEAGAPRGFDHEHATAPQWSDKEYVRGLLPELDLSFERGEATIAAESTEACWQLLSTSAPPLRAWLETLEPEEREDAGREYKQLLGDGSLTREYVLILGKRR